MKEIGKRHYLADERNELRNILVKVPTVLKKNPETWGRSFAREAILLRDNASSLAPVVASHILPFVDETLETLRDDSRRFKDVQLSPEEIGLLAEQRITSMSWRMAERFDREREPVTHLTVARRELLQQHPDTMREYYDPKTGMIMFGLKHPDTDEWYDAAISEKARVWYKGGFARAVLKAHAGASYREELPWNDLDVIYIGDEAKAREAAEKMGVDHEGVEYIGEKDDSFDFSEYAYGRDIDMNMVAFGSDGLHYSPEAYNSAQTGHINLIGEYLPNRAIYGIDKIKYQNTCLVKPRGAMRFVKTVSEGKATSFNYPAINENLGLGVYSLFLARRWSARENFGEIMQRMLYLTRQMGLVREDLTDIYELLDDTHRHAPHFDMERSLSGVVDVVRWKSGKFIKQVDREFGWRFRSHADLALERKENDTAERIITLEGFIPSAEESRRIEAEWPVFYQRCVERRKAYERLGLGNTQRYFYESEERITPFDAE